MNTEGNAENALTGERHMHKNTGPMARYFLAITNPCPGTGASGGFIQDGLQLGIRQILGFVGHSQGFNTIDKGPEVIL